MATNRPSDVQTPGVPGVRAIGTDPVPRLATESSHLRARWPRTFHGVLGTVQDQARVWTGYFLSPSMEWLPMAPIPRQRGVVPRVSPRIPDLESDSICSSLSVAGRGSGGSERARGRGPPVVTTLATTRIAQGSPSPNGKRDPEFREQVRRILGETSVESTTWRRMALGHIAPEASVPVTTTGPAVRLAATTVSVPAIYTNT